MRPRLYRDSVHGQIRLDRTTGFSDETSERALGFLVPEVWKTKAFQRLRHIRQNGLTNYVFAGMEHSRFVHSVGVFNLARRMYDSVSRNGDLEVDHRVRTGVAIAGLLHDIGHGPFSHTLEEALHRCWEKHNITDRSFSHEAMTVKFISEDDELRPLLTKYDTSFPRYVSSFIEKSLQEEEAWAYRIVSSQMDADRIDYMIRDARLAGIEGHGFDLERLLDMLVPCDKNRLALDSRATPTIEAYLLMNLQLYQIVYFHKTARAAHRLLSSIILRAFDLVVSGTSNHLDPLPSIAKKCFLALLNDGGNIDLAQYKKLTEYHFWAMISEWTECTDQILRDLSQRLLCRNLLRSRDHNASREKEQWTNLVADGRQEMADILKIEVDEVNRYYLFQDDSRRTGYKLYVWNPSERDDGKGNKDEAIWLSFDGTCQPIDQLIGKNQIFTAMLQEQMSERILFPDECSSVVKRYLG